MPQNVRSPSTLTGFSMKKLAETKWNNLITPFWLLVTEQWVANFTGWLRIRGRHTGGKFIEMKCRKMNSNFFYFLNSNDGYILMSARDNNCGVMTDPTYVLMDKQSL